MGNIKFSVVVPVYNCQKYIGKCLKSILKQSYNNYEIIVVNDGSTDNSERIIKKFAGKSDKIKLINQKNAGELGARKTGINAADGDYILFVDSDDLIKKNAIQKCFEAICKYNADIVQFKMIQILGPFRKNPPDTEIVVFNHEEFIAKYVYGLAGGSGIVHRSIDKAYRKDIISRAYNMQNQRYRIWGDGYTNLLAMINPDVKTTVLTNDRIYYYRHGSGITSNTDQIMQYTECMKTKAAIYDVLAENNISTYMLGVCVSENAGLTRYYLEYRFSKCTDNAEKEKIYKETMNLPAVKQTTEYAKAHPEWIDENNIFLTFDFEKCREYIDAHAEQDLKQTLSVKIKLLLHKIF